MTPDCPPTCRPSEPHAGVSDGVTTSACSVETTRLPSTRAASRCHTPSCLSRPLLPTGCFTPCYLAGSCNIPCWVGNYAWCEDGAFNSNEKETMQFLNDRLASYLEKVRGLEEMNAELERRIRERCDADLPLVCPDYQCYFNTIEDLQQKILCTKAENSRLTIQLDNCKLAAEDFRSKYESELTLHQLVEGDIGGLRRILDELTLCKADLEAQVESLKDDLLCLKKSHEEEVNLLRGQLGDRLNVELDSGPVVDLNRVLEEMRCQYEMVLASNRRDVEEWFAVQMGELNQQQLSSAEQLQGCQMEILELKRTASALEIELQAQQSLSQLEAEMKIQQLALSRQDASALALELEHGPATPSGEEERGGTTQSLEGTVAETEAQYSTQLAQMQCLIDNVENQLAEIRCDLERQNLEYEVLLDTKARLEGEIATYRGLLESEDCRLPCNPCSTTSPSSNTCEPCPAYVLCTVENHCV